MNDRILRTSAVTFLTLAATAVLTLGCTHNPYARDIAFTQEWAYQRQRDREQRPQIDELVLLGDEEGARASVKVDERGRPYLNVFEKRGISADLDAAHDEVEVGLKYKKEWGPKRPPRPIPKGRRTLE